MAISNIVCRGFGNFGGGVHRVVTRGYGIGAPVNVVKGPLIFCAAAVYRPGTQAAEIYRPGMQAGGVSG